MVEVEAKVSCKKRRLKVREGEIECVITESKLDGHLFLTTLLELV